MGAIVLRRRSRPLSRRFLAAVSPLFRRRGGRGGAQALVAAQLHEAFALHVLATRLDRAFPIDVGAAGGGVELAVVEEGLHLQFATGQLERPVEYVADLGLGAGPS